MTTCISCGSPIPDGQGRSCSMCYGDISYGKDGYYAKWAEDQIQQENEEKQDRDEHDKIVNDMCYDNIPF